MSETVWKREAGYSGQWGSTISHNGKMYTAWNPQTLYSFTPGDDQWTRVVSSENYTNRYGLTGLGDDLYWMGWDAEELMIYSVSTGELSYGPNMPGLCFMFMPVAADRKVYVPGGRLSFGTYNEDINTLNIYDVATKTWSQGASMNVNRACAATVLVDNKIYVFGGTDLDAVHKTAEVYDITTDEWTYIRELPETLQRAGVTLHNGKIYICGGAKDNSANGVLSTWVYDIVNDIYTEGPELPGASTAVNAAVLDGRLYVDISGHGLYSLALEDIDEPDPGPGPNPGPEPEPGEGGNGCVKMRIEIEGCSNNGFIKRLGRMMADSDCDCDCDCACR